jgi:hypothetical protein
MIEALPELINTQTFLSDKALGILKSIVQDSFVIKVMFIRRLYKLMSEKEKIAQSTHFGPFQYKHLVDSLASELQELKTSFIDVTTFLKDGNVKSHSEASSHTNYDYINLWQTAVKINLEKRGELEALREDIVRNLMDDNSNWIDQICNEAPIT